MLTDEVKTRIEDQVAALAGRVREAGDLAQLVRGGVIPPTPTSAFVVPLGLRARSEGDAGTGYFIQATDETVGVVLVVRAAGDARGDKALPGLGTLIDALVAAIAGWAPGDQIGVFRLSRGALLSAGDGMVVYQLDFSISDQVRNVT